MNMKWLWVGLLTLWPMLSAAETWSGKVASVETGDRLTLKSGKKLIKIRLAGIEAPAAGQYGNKKSRKSLAELCLNRKATADIPSLPAKGLAVGTLGCNWSKKVYADAGFYQVDQGMAWLLASETDPGLVRTQALAQSRCLGLWASSLPQCSSKPTVPKPGTPGGYACDGRIYCSQMRSCAEARFFLNNCPGVQMDGDYDGVPCEQQWCQ